MSTTIGTNTGTNGFFSDISGVLGRLGDIALDTASEILPVWATQQLNLQSKDQLSAPTFQETKDTGVVQNQLTTRDAAGNQPNPTQNSFVLDQNTLLLLGGGFILTLLFLR